VSLQHLEDDELREGLEGGDQAVLLQHLRQDAEDQRPRRPHVVRQVLEEEAKDGPGKERERERG
jgi:hypothetical protein